MFGSLEYVKNDWVCILRDQVNTFRLSPCSCRAKPKRRSEKMPFFQHDLILCRKKFCIWWHSPFLRSQLTFVRYSQICHCCHNSSQKDGPSILFEIWWKLQKLHFLEIIFSTYFWTVVLALHGRYDRYTYNFVNNSSQKNGSSDFRFLRLWTITLYEAPRG